MKKFIFICRHYLAEILLALVSLIICVAGLFFTSLFDILFRVFIVSVVAYVVAVLFLIKREKPQRSLVASVDGDSKNDPLPEPAEKLPYVYYNKPVEQEAHTIRYYSPYLGKVREIHFRPRKIRGKSFDNVRGIVVADNLILLRSILFTANFPDDIREIAKQYEGRLPNKGEIEQIYAKFDEINQNLYECGESLLKRGKYLYTCGNEADDRLMNYCLNFATGEESCAYCDSLVGAVLVETPLDVSLKEFLEKHLDQIKHCDDFDVLCEVNGKKVRLPFSKRHSGKPIGIFPFKDEPEYLELEEVENKKHTDKDVDESRILDKHFCCARVSKVVDRLNLYLRKMNKPVLEGYYLADNSSYMPGCGWIIGFDNTGDYYGGNVPAKLRYMGRFYGACQK